jgi:hypothetical protein
VYMNLVPETFIETKSCPADARFSYELLEAGQSYAIRYCIGKATGRVPKGINIATEKTISTRVINKSLK